MRTIGATVVLAGVAVAAMLQMGSNAGESAIALAPEIVTTSTEPVTSTAVSEPGSTTTSLPPFVYRVGVLANASTANFWEFYANPRASVWDAYILGPTRTSLYRFDGATGTLVGDLAAEDAEPIFDGESWLVRVPLRDDLFWSDGEPVTAHDYVFTFDTVRTLGLGGSWAGVFPPEVASVTADGDHHLTIRYSARPTLASWPNGPGVAPLMARHVWESAVPGADAATLLSMDGVADVSGGPLTIATMGEGLTTSVRNEFHPGSGPDVVEYLVFEDEVAAAEALAAGDIDVVLSPKGLAPDVVAGLAGAPEVAVTTNAGNAVRYLGFNLTRAPMSDSAFRSALALLLDRQAMASAVSAETGVAHTFVRPENTAWYDEERAAAISALYQGDLAARLATAVAELKAAGYAWAAEPTVGEGGVVAGTGLTIDGAAPSPLTILTPGDAYDPARPEQAATIAETLGWLGFDVRPVETDFDSVVDLAFVPDGESLLRYDMYILGWTLGNPALPGYYRPLFASDGVMNNTGYVSAAFDGALARYEAAFNLETARTALWDMETILARDLPYLLLYDSQTTEAHRSDHVRYGVESSLGGIQGRLGGIGDVTPVR